MDCDFLTLTAPGVADLAPYQPGKPLSELEREYGIRDAVKLASNENPLGSSPAALEAVRGVLGGLARYPDGNGFELKQALSARHGVGTKCITLGNGSNEVLELVARAFLCPGNNAVYSQYAFVVYPLVTRAAGATGIEVPAKDWGHDLDAMAAAVTPQTRVVFIANPNNPTGTRVSAKDLEPFLAGLPTKVVVVVDEAYFEYVEEDDYPGIPTWLGRYANLIVTRTFSKAYGLAGLRVGYGLSSPRLADILNRVREPFNVNSLALAGACAALDDEGHLQRSREANRAGMARLVEVARRSRLEYIPSAGNFLTLRMPRPGVEVYEGLLRKGVIVRPVANYGMPEHLRVTIGSEAENERFARALAEVLAEGAGGDVG